MTSSSNHINASATELVALCNVAIAAKIEARNAKVQGYILPISVSRACRYAYVRAERIQKLREAQPDLDSWKNEADPDFGRWLKAQAAVAAAFLAQASADADADAEPQDKNQEERAEIFSDNDELKDAEEETKKQPSKQKSKKNKNKNKKEPQTASPSLTPAQQLCAIIGQLEKELTTCTGPTGVAVGRRCCVFARLSGAYAALSLCERFDIDKTTQRAISCIDSMVKHNRLHKRTAKAALEGICSALAYCRQVQVLIPGFLDSVNASSAESPSRPRVGTAYLAELASLAADAIDLVCSSSVKKEKEKDRKTDAVVALPKDALRFVSLALNGPDPVPESWLTIADVIDGVPCTDPALPGLLNRLGDIFGQRTYKPTTEDQQQHQVDYWDTAIRCYNKALQVARLHHANADSAPDRIAVLRAQIQRDVGFVSIMAKRMDTAKQMGVILAASRLLHDTTRLFNFEFANLNAGRKAGQCSCGNGVRAPSQQDPCPCSSLLTTGADAIPIIGGTRDEDMVPLELKRRLERLMATFSGFYLILAMYLAHRVSLVAAEGSISKKWLQSLYAVMMPCISRAGAELGGKVLPGEDLLPKVTLETAKDQKTVLEIEINRMAFAGMCIQYRSGAIEVETVLDPEDGFFVGPGEWVPLSTVVLALGSSAGSCLLRLQQVYYDTFVSQLVMCTGTGTGIGIGKAQQATKTNPKAIEEQARYIACVLARERIICGIQNWQGQRLK